MQKRAITTLLFCLCLVLGHFNSIAQTRIIAQADDGTQTVYYYMDDEMNVYFKTKEILIANLVMGTGDHYILPPGSEPMYLEFKINGVPYETFALNTFSFSHYVNGYPVFKSHSESFSVNFGEICPAVFTGEYIFSMTWSIVNHLGEIYPIHNTQYSNPDGIFSCRVFSITCPDCQLPPKVSKLLWLRNDGYCPPISAYNTDPVSHMSGTTDCKSSARPGHSTDPPLGEVKLLDAYSIDQRETVLNKVNISPNPFGADFQLSYQLTEQSKVRIAIFNSNGQMMYQNVLLEDIGRHDWTIDTREWPNGIYHCQIQTAHDNQMLKMVKAH